ncbi:MAG: NUDIX hydrolase [Desulfomonilaceae bacterium]
MEKDLTNFDREYFNTPLFGVGALIVSGSEIALIRRAKEPSKGQWSIPGGLVNLGESLLEAVMREAYEETGLIVQPYCLVEILERIIHDDAGSVKYHYILADYLCEVKGGILNAGSDASEACWAPCDKLQLFDLSDFTFEVISKGFNLHFEKSIA